MVKALRLPTRVSMVTYWFASTAHAILLVRVRLRASGRSKVPPGPGPLIVPASLSFRLARAWTRMGSLRSSGDPSCASAPFQDPGRTNVSSPLAVTSMLPPLCGRRRLRRWLISGLTRSFGTCCHTLQRVTCRTRARLASGWPAEPLPRGIRTLWIAAKGFSSFDDCPPFLLSRRYRIPLRSIAREDGRERP